MGLLVEGTDYEVTGNQRGDVYNTIVIKTINTVDSGDTIVVDVTKYGSHPKGIMGVEGFEHTTEDSVIVAELPTTTVSGDNITLTVGGSSNKARTYLIHVFAVQNLGSAV